MKVQDGLHGDGGILPAHSRSPLYGLHIVNRLQGGVQAVVGEPELRPLHAYALLGIAAVLPVRQIERSDQGNGRKRHVVRPAACPAGTWRWGCARAVRRTGSARPPPCRTPPGSRPNKSSRSIPSHPCPSPESSRPAKAPALPRAGERLPHPATFWPACRIREFSVHFSIWIFRVASSFAMAGIRKIRVMRYSRIREKQKLPCEPPRTLSSLQSKRVAPKRANAFF